MQINEHSHLEETKDGGKHSGLTEDMDNLSLDNDETHEKTSNSSQNKKKKKPAKKTVTPSSSINTRSRFAAMQKNTIKKQKVGVVYDDLMLLHRNHRAEHPERPERLMAIYLNFVKKEMYKTLVEIDSSLAEEEDLILAHSHKHVQSILNCSLDKFNKDSMKAKENRTPFTTDTYTNKFTSQAALIAAGSTIEAVTAVCNSQVDTAFAIVRPPGHHAHGAVAGGFCFFNNAAVAARVAQKKLGAKKVVIFDWDVHVGEGTASIFYDDPSVLYISIHRFDMGKFYPGPIGKYERIGEGSGKGFNIQFPFNVPQQKNDLIGDKDYVYACESVFFPVIKEFKPDLMIISAGFDSALGDPLGQVGVTPQGYAYMTWGLRALCKKTVVVLEGGYDLQALEVSSVAVLRTLQVSPEDPETFNKLLAELSGKPDQTLSQLETESLMMVRESFKQTASNLAKMLKKQWPVLSSLIFEKSRKGSGVSSSPSSQSFGELGATNSAVRLGEKARTMSMQDDQLASATLHDVPMRNRSDSYVVEDPIPETFE